MNKIFLFFLMLCIVNSCKKENKNQIDLLLLKKNGTITQSYNDTKIAEHLKFLDKIQIINNEIKNNKIYVSTSRNNNGWIEIDDTSYLDNNWVKFDNIKDIKFNYPNDFKFTFIKAKQKTGGRDDWSYEHKLFNEKYFIIIYHHLKKFDIILEEFKNKLSKYPSEKIKENDIFQKTNISINNNQGFYTSGIDKLEKKRYFVYTMNGGIDTYTIKIFMEKNDNSEKDTLIAMKILFSLRRSGF